MAEWTNPDLHTLGDNYAYASTDELYMLLLAFNSHS